MSVEVGLPREEAMKVALAGAGALLGVVRVRNLPLDSCPFCAEGKCYQEVRSYGPSPDSPDGFDIVIHDRVD